MDLRRVLQGMLCLSVFVTMFSTVPVPRNRKRKMRPCRCKKLFKDINDVIDSKFKTLEEKFAERLPIVNDLSVNDTLSLQEMNSRMSRLYRDVQATDEVLRRESLALRQVKEHMQTQSDTMGNMSEGLSAVEAIVRNLTKVVENLRVISSSSISNAIVHQTTTITEVPTTHAPHQPEVPSQVGPAAIVYPRHCHDVYRSGGLRYEGDYYIMIQPERAPAPYKALCKAREDGGWTVIQRRLDGAVDFYRNWTEYKNGFGSLSGEFWIGNDNIHRLSSQGKFKLRVEMEQWNGSKYHAIYDFFRIEDETNDYRLHVNGYHGTAGDSMTSTRENHDGVRFSTYDTDNDRRPFDNCAMHYRGGWWYNDCFDSNLNGRYYQKGFHNNFFRQNGIHWNSLHKYSSLKNAQMMVMPASDFTAHNKVSPRA
ncbi:fibrinogen-like protein 1 [Mizuhopecten yessoensis]|uniref:Angiopoietin-related protein 1 n=1 Tax=Mizuhopecten yessoensis TaxID=6573 RepID=A0A210PRL5_MIZYE|nr:fibrinogen-like protein 1 [Mizuhopecten yessoensis]XP_021376912.1 fibrinogen-like protein 1 [Mizuhopecten yessoensis]XP_021376913.1 fibrinogen-like protein 1 [Mizuhopecten yessoensis]OWF39130.1 Angiopoietin-related protein 1 [Mizuhopecten yessoensis]